MVSLGELNPISMRRNCFAILFVLLNLALAVQAQESMGPARQHTGSQSLQDTTLSGAKDLFAYPAIRHFYAARGYRLAWHQQGGTGAAADSLLRILERAPYYGLQAANYQLAALAALLVRTDLSVAEQERAELLLTNAFLSMARHLQQGRYSPHTNKRIRQMPMADTSLALVLQEALQTGDLRQALEAQEPVHAQYHLLKKALKSLMDEAPLEASAKPEAGGKRTSQLKQLIANLERWRWEAPRLPQQYLLVNIPAYKLQVFEDAALLFETRVIVGKPATPTPVLESKIECFVIYPYWTVPRSIAVGEILPRLKKDPAYLQRNNFEVLDQKGKVVDAGAIDWQAYSASTFPFTFRQLEGSGNALGMVKFVFDNPFSVYLHDTNARHLFGNSQRALSHGCIRVEKAEELAQLLLRKDSTYADPAKLSAYFSQKRKREISLPEPMPIFIRYYTAAHVGDSLLYYPDIYRKDAGLSH